MPTYSCQRVQVMSKLKAGPAMASPTLAHLLCGHANLSGLTSLSDDIVFLHLTLAFLSDECTVPLLRQLHWNRCDTFPREAPLLLPPMGTESSAAHSRNRPV